MLKLDAEHFVWLMQYQQELRHLLGSQQATRELDKSLRRALVGDVADLQRACRSLGLFVSVRMAEHITKATTMGEAVAAFQASEDAILAELEGRIFFEPEAKYKPYFENSKLFGEVVFNAFTSANDDITEAGTCLALERGTACVMHLMRVVDCGLAALAKALGVAKQNDWGRYLNKISEELKKRYELSGARSEPEQFYSEVAITMDQMRRAWRNPTFHVEKSYSLDRAEVILRSVQSFMMHLAKEVSE